MRSLSRRFSSSPSPQLDIKQDIDSLIDDIRAQVPIEVLDTLNRSGEADAQGNFTVVLKRYLIAEKLDVQKAAARLAKQAKWREKTFGNAAEIQDDEVATSISQNKVFLHSSHIPGTRPLLIILGRNHLPLNFDECERFIAYCLEAGTWLCDNTEHGDGKAVGIIDLKGLGWRNLDAQALKACFFVLNQCYPERMHRIYMLDAPRIFDGLWRVVSPFIDANSREKIRFVSGPTAQEKLLEYVHRDVLPKQYGGNGELVPVYIAANHVRTIRKAALEKKCVHIGSSNGKHHHHQRVVVGDSALSLVDEDEDDDDVFEDALEEFENCSISSV